MQAIDRLRRGFLSKQFFKAPPGKSGKRGPYSVLQGFFRGKKISERISAEDVPNPGAGGQLSRSQGLAEKYVTLRDEITRLKSQDAGNKKLHPER